jgi:5-methylcytosine-specific restriction enzyme subunit McrC
MNRRTISVFEHECIRSTGKLQEDRLHPHELRALQLHHGEKGVPYYSLIHQGVKFREYVGVIQVGPLTIEVLPKIDRGSKEQWRNILVDMLRKVGAFQVTASSEASLRVKNNSILDLYLEYFINQVEDLQHKGLIKAYRQKEGNTTALKGKLLFQKHVIKNAVHKERFYVRYTIYDADHMMNQLLYKTLVLIKKINTNSLLASKVSRLLLDFPEVQDIKVIEEHFDKLVYTKKNEHYERAMEISRLLLLNYFPDISSGTNNVLALMFDMNLLWEKFVFQSLSKYLTKGTVEPQLTKPYWKLSGKRAVKLKPDVLINIEGLRYVLDTKWKLPERDKPSYADLQQMYAYGKYFKASHTLLCYPGSHAEFHDGYFFNEDDRLNSHYRCSVLKIAFNMDRFIERNFITLWQQEIATKISLHF